MPSLGADMESGKLVEWLKHPGEALKKGDVLAVVETQKGAIEVDVFEAAIVDRLLVEPGATVPVGTPLAMLRQPGEAPGQAPAAPAAPAKPVLAEPPRPPVAVAPPPAAAAPMPPSAPAQPAARPRVTPAARREAAEKGIDLAGIVGTGPGGAVTSADIAGAAAAATPSPAAPARRGFDADEMRKAIAAAMARAKREIPHYYLANTIDLSAANAWLAETNAARPPAERLLLSALLIKATALALRRFAEFNGFHVQGAFRPSAPVHVGVAIAIRGGGLVAPAIHDTDRMSVDQVMAALRDLVARSRAGALRSSEMTDPTVTVTNLGERGVEQVFPVIYPPQVAIIGFGKPVERPMVVAGRIEKRACLSSSLAGDHRVSDGHRGALFLAEIEHLLQQPEAL